MHKIDKWEGQTQNPPHGFDVEIYKDITAGKFVAKIKSWSQMWRVYSNILQEHCEEVRDDDLNQLCERTKQQIVNRGGRILTPLPPIACL